jgi:hypothetical protein
MAPSAFSLHATAGGPELRGIDPRISPAVAAR